MNNANTTRSIDYLKSRVMQTENEIDQLVAELYGLSAAEVEMVADSTNMSSRPTS